VGFWSVVERVTGQEAQAIRNLKDAIPPPPPFLAGGPHRSIITVDYTGAVQCFRSPPLIDEAIG